MYMQQGLETISFLHASVGGHDRSWVGGRKAQSLSLHERTCRAKEKRCEPTRGFRVPTSN
jgi:hypothetical protein